MGRKRHSHVFGKRHQMRQIDTTSWFLGYEYILLFLAAVFSGLMITTMYQTIDPTVVDIAIYQMVMGMVGLMMGITVNMKRSNVSPGLKIGMPTRKHGEDLFVYVTIAFIGLQIFNSLIGGINLNVFEGMSIDAAMNIGLTAAVMEEALYSLAFTTIAFSMALYIVVKLFGRVDKVIETVAMVMASIAVGLLFVVIHFGTYGQDPQIMLILFVNRFVYSIVYIRTRNIMVPTALHLAHNAVALGMLGF